MNTTTGLDQHAAAWLAEGPTELSDRVLDAALREVHVTKQRRAPRVPWRFPLMPSSLRAAVAVALVVTVGGGGLIYLNSIGREAAGSPDVSAAPTPTATSYSFWPGIPRWTTYESEVYAPFGLSVPSDWPVTVPAARTWQAGDTFQADGLPYADKFFSAEDEDAQIGLFFWVVPAGEGADIESVEGLTAWAESFCNDVDGLSCEEFRKQAARMCDEETQARDCKPAILVPTTTVQYAFVPNWGTLEFFGLEFAEVRVVVVARDDSFPPAGRYGGSVELLKSVLTTMHVWGPH